MQKKIVAIVVILGVCALFATIDQQDTFLRFRPKEYDLTLITQAESCELPNLLEGLCQGANWAQVFTQTLYLTKCLQSFDPQPRLSSEDLLQCINVAGDKCANNPKDLTIVDTIKNYLVNTGLPTYTCLPFKQVLTFNLHSQCPAKCADGSVKTTEATATDLRQMTVITDIQDHIISSGPVIIALKYGSSFNNYQSGVYNTSENDLDFGIRFLMVVGWSTTATGEVQWRSVNTFGDQFGQAGRILISSQDQYIKAIYAFDVDVWA